MRKLLFSLIALLMLCACWAQEDYGMPNDWEWTSLIGGDGGESITDIAKDSNGDLIACGFFSGSITMSDNTYESTGLYDLFVMKVSPDDGSLIWFQAIEAIGAGQILGSPQLALDQADNAFISSSVNSAEVQINDVTIGASGDRPYLLANFDSAGELVFAEVSPGGIAPETTNFVKHIASSDDYLYINFGNQGYESIVLDHEGNWVKSINSTATVTDIVSNGTNVYWAVNAYDIAYFDGYTVGGLTTAYTGYIIETNLAGDVDLITPLAYSDDGTYFINDLDMNDAGNLFAAVNYSGNVILANDLELYSSFDDVVVLKLNEEMSIEWATSTESSPSPNSERISVDGDVFLYVEDFSGAITIDNAELDGSFRFLIQLDDSDGSYLSGTGVERMDFFLANDGATYSNLFNQPNISLLKSDGDYNFVWTLESVGESGFAQPMGGLAIDNNQNIFTFLEFGGYLNDEISTPNEGAAVMKTNMSGEFVGATPFTSNQGISISSYGDNIALDNNGHILIGFSFSGELTLPDGEVIDNENGPVLIVKLDADLNMIWHKQISATILHSLATDNTNNIFVTGSFSETYTIDNTTFESYGSDDLFLTKLNTDGDHIWSKQLGGEAIEYILIPDTDEAGNCYVAGEYTSLDVYIGDELLNTEIDNSKTIVTKFSADGTLVWNKILGDIVNEESAAGCWPSDVETDDDGNTYIVGWHSDGVSFDGVNISNPISASYPFNNFVAKISPDSELLWVNPLFMGSYDFIGSQLALDDYGNCYFGGRYRDTLNFHNQHTLISEDNSSQTYFTKYNSEGELQWIKTVQNLHNSTASLTVGTAVFDNKLVIANRHRLSYQYDDTVIASANTNTLLAMMETGEESSVNNESIADAHSLIAYPNPAVNFTQLSYELKQASEVVIRVYGSDGKLVKQVDLDHQTMGSHEFKLNLESSGLFLIELVSTQGVQTVKLRIEAE